MLKMSKTFNLIYSESWLSPRLGFGFGFSAPFHKLQNALVHVVELRSLPSAVLQFFEVPKEAGRRVSGNGNQ